MTSKGLLRNWQPLILSTSLFSAIGSVSAKVIFKADFETGDLSQWSSTGASSQNATPRNIQVVTDVVQEEPRSTKTMCSTPSNCERSLAARELRSKRVPTPIVLLLYLAEPRRTAIISSIGQGSRHAMTTS
jgi:hypothetical protein